MVCIILPKNKDKKSETTYKASNICNYSYFPQYDGTSRDEKNAMSKFQPKEFYDSLGDDIKRC